MPQPQPPRRPVDIHHERGSRLATAGFVCGLLGLFFVWIPFLGQGLALIGIVCGALALRRADEADGAGKTKAKAGLALGVGALMVTGLMIWDINDYYS